MLPVDATLRTIRDSLSVEYVRRVLEMVRACDTDVGDAQVRIALNDSAPHPAYSISAVMDFDTGETMHWGTFGGRYHKELSLKKQQVLRWSTNHMTAKEVGELIGEMRVFIKRPRRHL